MNQTQFLQQPRVMDTITSTCTQVGNLPSESKIPPRFLTEFVTEVVVLLEADKTLLEECVVALDESDNQLLQEEILERVDKLSRICEIARSKGSL